MPAGVSPPRTYHGNLNRHLLQHGLQEKGHGERHHHLNHGVHLRDGPADCLAPDLHANAKGQREFRDHFEVVIFNEGVNIWRYSVADGKLVIRKAAFASFRLEKNVKYLLKVNKTDKTLTVSIAGHSFGYFDDALPDAYYVGITGCEGLNRFYDFAVGR